MGTCSLETVDMKYVTTIDTTTVLEKHYVGGTDTLTKLIQGIGLLQKILGILGNYNIYTIFLS